MKTKGGENRWAIGKGIEISDFQIWALSEWPGGHVEQTTGPAFRVSGYNFISYVEIKRSFESFDNCLNALFIFYIIWCTIENVT